MKLKFITFEHVAEALKFLVSKDGGHLLYTDESGKPNHRLMGAAWAALHGGYRGQKYEGADKSKAISKLKAVYKSEKMDTPTESLVLDGEFFEESLAQSDSYDSIRSRVQAALDKAIRMGADMDLDADDDSMTGCYCWVRDLFPGTVVYSMEGDLFQVDYTDDGETVTLGTPVEVEMSYTPVTQESLSESASPGKFRAFAQETFSLQEAVYDQTKGELTVTVIKPGFSGNTTKGKRRFYPEETLKRDHKVFDRVKMFADHQTEAENRARPEGSVHNWVASMSETWPDSDGTIKGRAILIDPVFKAKVDRLNESGCLNQLELSIRAAAMVGPATIQGEEAMCIESIEAARSVDFVCQGAAGGRVEMMESYSEQFDVDLISESDFRSRRPDIVASIQSVNQGANVKSLETQLQESQTQLAAAIAEKKAAEAKVQESEKAAKKATVQAELSKMLTESKLPEFAQKRIREQYKDAVEVAGIKESIDGWKEDIKTASGPTLVKGLGRSNNGSTEESAVAESRTVLEESFKAAGLTEEQAKIAAAGR